MLRRNEAPGSRFVTASASARAAAYQGRISARLFIFQVPCRSCNFALPTWHTDMVHPPVLPSKPRMVRIEYLCPWVIHSDAPNHSFGHRLHELRRHKLGLEGWMWPPRVYLVKEGGAIPRISSGARERRDRPHESNICTCMGNHQRLARLGQDSSLRHPTQKGIPCAKPVDKGF